MVGGVELESQHATFCFVGQYESLMEAALAVLLGREESGKEKWPPTRDIVLPFSAFYSRKCASTIKINIVSDSLITPSHTLSLSHSLSLSLSRVDAK